MVFAKGNKNGINPIKKVIECSNCGITFKRQNSLKKHLNSLIKCTEKPTPFANANKIETKFICEVCGRNMKLSYYDTHMRMHMFKRINPKTNRIEYVLYPDYDELETVLEKRRKYDYDMHHELYVYCEECKLHMKRNSVSNHMKYIHRINRKKLYHIPKVIKLYDQLNKDIQRCKGYKQIQQTILRIRIHEMKDAKKYAKHREKKYIKPKTKEQKIAYKKNLLEKQNEISKMQNEILDIQVQETLDATPIISSRPSSPKKELFMTDLVI